MQEIVQYSKCIYPFQTQNTHTQAQRETERERVYLHTQRQFDVLYINKSRKNLQKKSEDKWRDQKSCQAEGGTGGERKWWRVCRRRSTGEKENESELSGIFQLSLRIDKDTVKLKQKTLLKWAECNWKSIIKDAPVNCFSSELYRSHMSINGGFRTTEGNVIFHCYGCVRVCGNAACFHALTTRYRYA